ncbi:uncharacterized protein LOC127281159 isoform X6 [Leptopilina boulardi]|uniref:uncharacterized protein LOC127281159 isoform X6 n=1 Tax=Leptopilina boulardi TaxID=63433 RepID=UPI0021F5BC9F|nr:uncharacterized protein LOC127281159 isoform X6 [Leptopilina boulardi]
MSLLLFRLNGIPMKFHLVDLSKELNIRYTSLIEKNGGEISVEPNEKIRTFTLPIFCHKYSFIFNIEYIDDCLKNNKILNIDDYYIGDTNVFAACTAIIMGRKICTCRKCGNQHIKIVKQGNNLNEAPKKLVEVEKIVFNSKNAINNEIQVSSVEENISRFSDDEEVSSVKKSEIIISDDNEEENSFEYKIESPTMIMETESESESEFEFDVNESELECNISDYSNSDDPDYNVKRLPKKRKTLRPKVDNLKRTRYNRLPITNIVDINLQDTENEPSTSKIDNDSEDESDDSSEPTVDLKEWAKKHVENVEKDKFGYPKKTHIGFSEEEDLLLIDLIVKTKSIYRTKGSLIWIYIKNLKIFPEDITDEIFKDHFRAKILPNIEKYNLNKKIEEKFIDYRTFGKIARKYPMNDLKKWAYEKTKNLKKDENGFPEGESLSFEKWEKRMIIDFLIRINPASNFSILLWDMACMLRLFPVHRTKESIQNELKFNILPKIESFDLAAGSEAIFLRLKKTARFKLSIPSNLRNWAEEQTKDMEKDHLGYPLAHNKFIQKWEKEMMLKYLLKIDNIPQACMPTTWSRAVNLKLFPLIRREDGLRHIMRTEILPDIEKFNMPMEKKEEFIKLRKSIRTFWIPTENMKIWAENISKDRKKDKYGYPISRSKKIEKWEQYLIIDFLVKFNFIHKCKQKLVWKLAYNLKIFPKKRTTNTLWFEVRNTLLPIIETFDIPNDVKVEFLKVRNTEGTVEGFLEPTEHLKKWAKNVTKNLDKDSDGYPIQQSMRSMSNIEKKICVDFLVESERIHLSLSHTTWELAFVLKLLPKCRSTRNMRTIFKRCILPSIKQYNLPRHIEEEFLKLTKNKKSRKKNLVHNTGIDQQI